jgi:hypothetical protein
VAVDPTHHAAAIEAMRRAGAELPLDFETMFDGFAWNLARLLIETMPRLTSEQACMLVGIGGAMLRQHAAVTEAKAMRDRLDRPEGQA